MSNNAHDLSKRLLNALDNDYNVVDMHAVNEIISILEKINITKELLETTRLGKTVNELRRKTSEPTLARRAKVLVKRWRDLVVSSTASPAHSGLPGSNRSSAERTVRRLGGTPLTSPALSLSRVNTLTSPALSSRVNTLTSPALLSRQVVSPAVPSPRPASRPAWGGYESDSQDVILVDDDPPPPAAPPATSVPTPAKRPISPTPPVDEKKAKRDKKPKKRRGHGRTGSEAPTEAWAGRNGSSPPPPPRRNGCRPPVDKYSALVQRMPPAGAKKVKTTKELLEEIQSRGAKPVPLPESPGSPDVMLIEPDSSELIKVGSPLRNGTAESRVPSPEPAPPAVAAPPAEPLPPLEDEREYQDCTCGEEALDSCPAARQLNTIPLHVKALHHAYLPGINGTRAPLYPHQFAVRKLTDEDKPDLFTSVVPLYKYSDYADDYCVKNMSRVPLCTHLPWTEFAPPPPSPPPLPPPPSPRPYPIDEKEVKEEPNSDDKPNSPKLPQDDDTIDFEDLKKVLTNYKCAKIEAEMVSVPVLEPSDRLKAPILDDDEPVKSVSELKQCGEEPMDVSLDFVSEPQEHRTVERTKVSESIDGRTLYAMCEKARSTIPFTYSQTCSTPVVTLPLEESEVEAVLEEKFSEVVDETDRDGFGRPVQASNFAEWHECAKLGDLIALPYVVID